MLLPDIFPIPVQVFAGGTFPPPLSFSPYPYVARIARSADQDLSGTCFDSDPAASESKGWVSMMARLAVHHEHYCTSERRYYTIWHDLCLRKSPAFASVLSEHDETQPVQAWVTRDAIGWVLQGKAEHYAPGATQKVWPWVWRHPVESAHEMAHRVARLSEDLDWMRSIVKPS